MPVNNLIYQSFKIPNRSGHYLGHHALLTTGIGTITPVLCHPVIPGTKVNLNQLISASLAPLASDCYLRTSCRVEMFAVPLRFLYGGYEQWLTKENLHKDLSTAVGVQLPCISFSGAAFKALCGPGTLADYLGVRVNSTDMAYIGDTDTVKMNIFPFLAYNYIWDTWYRRPDVQNSFFKRPAFSSSINTTDIQYLPYIAKNGTSKNDYSVFGILPNSASGFYSLRQRNFSVDYFTSAQLTAQLGDAATVKVETVGSDNLFTISALRVGNSLQVFRDRLGVAGPRFNDYLKANYGTSISDSNGRRPILLGSGSIEFYTKGVDQAFSDTTASMSTNNPIKSVGATYGKPMCNGEIQLCKDFVAEEPMYIMVMNTVVPKVNYSSGVERYMLHYTENGCEVDLANPILQNVGNQEIKQAELSPAAVRQQNINDVFGYQQRYAEYMYRNDRVHGLFRTGGSLASYVSQRYIGQSPVLSNSFLQIPTNYLDNVSAVGSNISTYGALIDTYFDFSVSQPLYDSSIPSLVNPAEEHGKEVVVMRNGQRII